MTEQQLEKLLSTFFDIIKREKEVDNAFINYMKVIAPDSYAPILEDSLITTYLKWVEIFNPEIAYILSYYAWDYDTNWLVEINWKEYILKTKEDLFNYITKEILWN